MGLILEHHAMSALITISEFQKIFRVSRSTVCRLIKRGEIGCVHVGRAVRIPSEDVDAFMQRLHSVG